MDGGKREWWWRVHQWDGCGESEQTGRGGRELLIKVRLG